MIDRESNRNTRWIKEAIWIKKTRRNKGDTDSATYGAACLPCHLVSRRRNSRPIYSVAEDGKTVKRVNRTSCVKKQNLY